MIPQLIFDWSKKTPDRTAIIYNGRSLSYGAFAQIVAVARGYFARRDCFGAGYAVLAVRNLIDFWFLSLALRSLGLTTVVVGSVAEDASDSMPSVQDVVTKLGLANVQCVVTTPDETWASGLDDLCVKLGLRWLSVSLAGESALDYGAFETYHPCGGHIVLTSGTTGAHKMLLMSPDSDALFLRRIVELLGMNQNSVFSAFYFWAWTSVGYKWAASPWFVGGATLIEQSREPHHALRRPGITHGVLVPRMLSAVLAAPANAFPRNEAICLLIGGGAMTRAQADQAKSRITPRLFTCLASTEAGAIAMTSLDTPDDHRWHRLVHDRVVEIVDESDRVVPTGQTGRLRIDTTGGPNGYFNNETATRAFFKDGFFYPGDLAVSRPDGRIALQGRLTDVINVHGIKISPALFEDRICERLGVSGACLFSMQNGNGEEEFHVVIESPTPINSQRVTNIIRAEIQMLGISHALVKCVSALPRNQIGKVLRQAVRTQFTGT